MEKLQVAILGSGNIGTDLLMKIQRSDLLTVSRFIGKNKQSPNLRLAEEMGIKTSSRSITELKENPRCCDIVMDATSANAHVIHAPILEKLGVYTIDLTPSKIGKPCIPLINCEECLTIHNVNLITCGGQATIPIVYEICRICPNVEYIETVSTIAAKSAGKATRDNVDEFIETTSGALEQFTGVKNTKSIIVIDSSQPDINMRNTIYMRIPDIDLEKVKQAVRNVEGQLQTYVPGYNVVVGPTWFRGVLAVTVEVCGQGDYLPGYAGNLDIITSAAIEVAEQYARCVLEKEGWQF